MGLAVSAPHLIPIVITAPNTWMRKEEILNQLLLEPLETLKMVDKQSDFVSHKADGMRFGNVRTAFNAAIMGSRAAGCTQTRHNFIHSA